MLLPSNLCYFSAALISFDHSTLCQLPRWLLCKLGQSNCCMQFGEVLVLWYMMSVC